MKNLLKNIFIYTVCGIICTEAIALVKEKKDILNGGSGLSIATFIDYPPFGKTGNYIMEVDSVFQPFLDKYNAQEKNELYFANEGSYKELIDKTLNGEVDMLIGAYYNSQAYNGLTLIYPALTNNPVVAVTMPDNSINIKSSADLKNLKGGYDEREYFSDYVSNELNRLNMQKFNDSNKLYEQLFIGNLDYIVTSRYYGALEQAKLGIRGMVNMQKQALWDMPMFVGVSSLTRKGRFTINTLKEFMRRNQATLKQEIEQKIIEKIRAADEAARGTVPPAYIK